MSIDFKLPELGENVESGDIVNVLVHEGDTVAVNDGVFELETDKALVEIPCPYGGKVVKIHEKKGQTVKGGQTLLTIEAEVEAHVPPPPPKPAAPAAAPTKSAPEQKSAPKKAEAASGIVQTAAPQATVAIEQPATKSPIPAGPAARRVARELGVDLQQAPRRGQRG